MEPLTDAKAIMYLAEAIKLGGGGVVAIVLVRIVLTFIMRWQDKRAASSIPLNNGQLADTIVKKKSCIECGPMVLTMNKVETLEKLAIEESKAWILHTKDTERLVKSAENQEEYLKILIPSSKKQEEYLKMIAEAFANGARV